MRKGEKMTEKTGTDIDFDGVLGAAEELEKLGVLGSDAKTVILILKIAKSLGLADLFVKIANVIAERAAKKIFNS